MGVAAALSLLGAIAGLLLPGKRATFSTQTTLPEHEAGEYEAYDSVPEQSPIL